MSLTSDTRLPEEMEDDGDDGDNGDAGDVDDDAGAANDHDDDLTHSWSLPRRYGEETDRNEEVSEASSNSSAKSS